MAISSSINVGKPYTFSSQDNIVSDQRVYINIYGREGEFSNGVNYTKDIIVNQPLCRTICGSRLGYILFVDPHRCDDPNYGPIFFDKGYDCNGSYLIQSFLALDFALSDQTMISSQNSSYTFNMCKTIVTIELDESDNVVNNEDAQDPEAFVYFYYNKESPNALHNNADNKRIKNREYRYYDPSKILNPKCRFSYLFKTGEDEEMMWICGGRGDLSVEVRYFEENIVACENFMVAYLKSYLVDYEFMLSKAQNPKQVIAAIIVLAARIEASHFFKNGNNRLMVILIVKLLFENGLDPSFLWFPNGFSHYLLGELPKELSLDENCSFQNISMDRLEECLEGPINAILDGQSLYREVISDNQSNIIVIL